LTLLYTPCILDCALRFLIKFSTYLSKKKKNVEQKKSKKLSQHQTGTKCMFMLAERSWIYNYLNEQHNKELPPDSTSKILVSQPQVTLNIS